MRLNRLRVEQFRQFRQPLELDELQPGINLICGPNESGKSTLVRAIRAAFFERFSSSSVSDLRPWGDSAAAPEVLMEFDWQGQQWTLTKRFLQRKRCDLRIDGQSWSGDDAEEKLAELLGFQYPGRGASKAEHWGIPGLLWIEQGAGHELRSAVQHASDHLQSALGASLGEVASSGGDEILDAVETRLAALLTRTGKPTGEFARLKEQLREQEELLAQLDAKVISYRSDVDHLAELRRQHREDEQGRPWEGYRQRQQETEKALAEADQLQAAQAQDRQALKQCQDTIALVRSQLAAFREEQTQLESRRKAHARACEKFDQTQALRQDVEADLAAARAAYKQAGENVRIARTAEEIKRQQLEAQRVERELAELTGSLEKARAADAELSRQREQLRESLIDAADLKQLRQLHKEREELAIRQQSVATRFQFDLQPGQSIQLDGEVMQGQGEALLVSPTEVHLAGIGHLRIIPGGGDLSELSRQSSRLSEQYDSLLQRLRVESLAAAEERAERATMLERQAAASETLLATHAPRGIEHLARALQELVIRQQDQQQLLQTAAAPEQLLRLADAESALLGAEQVLKSAERRERDFHLDLNTATLDRNNCKAELERLSAQISSSKRAEQQAQLNAQLSDRLAEEQALGARIIEREARIAAARPQILRDDIQRFAATALQLEKAFRERELRLAEILSRLKAQSAEALEEQIAMARAEHQHLARRHSEMQRRADALSLLQRLVREKRRALTQRLQAPLQKHINHYLQLLFPQASLSVDENLVPVQLSRPGIQGTETGELDALSFGAREQMGLISRLAYADLLQEAGRPTLIILDDALVHSDALRLEDMKRVLFDAARRHQILLFSCHPDKWRDLGIATRNIAQMVAVSKA